MTAFASSPTETVAPAPDRSIDEIDADICRVATQLNAANYRFLMLIREFDDRFGWATWSFASCADWLAWRCGLTVSAAREKVRCAQALRSLPAISAAFAAGQLSYSKVRALTRAAHLRDEESLLAYAVDATAAQVEERCRQIRNVTPDSVHDARRAWERRRLSVWRRPEHGTLTITIEVPIEEGEVVARAIERAAGEESSGAPEFAEQSWRAQQADALVAIAKAYLAGGVAQQTSAADHYQVVVHVDDEALRGGVGRADLPIETIRRLACDGSIVTVVEDEHGTPLDVGRKQRTVSTPLRRALWSRDRGCSFPGCRRAQYVHAHHVHHWTDGGDTSLDNLVLLCSQHHRLLHEGGFRIRRDERGERYFARPDGRAIPRGGYRLADVLDDDAHADERGCDDPTRGEGRDGAATANPSAEGWLAAFANGRDRASQVREEVGRYSLMN